MSLSDFKVVARTHYDEFQRYLVEYHATSPPNARAAARQKLVRLTTQQLQELSTDVYEDLVRRMTNTPGNEVWYLPPNNEFHPKRNEARQKLGTLATTQFKDLASDVQFELAQRYPEFKEELGTTCSL